MFDGGGLALEDIVVVTYNYRTGPYGWLALPELWEESGNLTTDSYALLDQIAALRNGCMRTLRLLVVIRSASPPLASPLAKGIIAGAIAESDIRAPRDPASINLAEGYNNMTTNHLVVFGRQVQINPQRHDSRRASQGPSKNNQRKQWLYWIFKLENHLGWLCHAGNLLGPAAEGTRQRRSLDHWKHKR